MYKKILLIILLIGLSGCSKTSNPTINSFSNLTIKPLGESIATTTIASLLENKTSDEKFNIKATEIAKLDFKGKFKEKIYGVDIEILSLVKIDDGVQIMARAWKNDKQLGFGADGSVDIERFRIFNPPIMVDNINGTVIREYLVEGINKQRKLKEDPFEAILQSLAHTIKLVGKENSKIELGKVGNTTDTFYPAAGANSPVDGRVNYDTGAWATIHNAASSAGADATNETQFFGLARKEGINYAIYRSIFCFNTAAIGTDEISSAVLSIFENTNDAAIENHDATTADIVASAPATTDNIVVGDYSTLGTTVLGTIALASIATNQYNNFTLNANGITNINKAGVSKFGGRIGRDTIDSTPTDANHMYIFFADKAGTTNDPKLVVEHAAATLPTISQNSDIILFE